MHPLCFRDISEIVFRQSQSQICSRLDIKRASSFNVHYADDPACSLTLNDANPVSLNADAFKLLQNHLPLIIVAHCTYEASLYSPSRKGVDCVRSASSGRFVFVLNYAFAVHDNFTHFEQAVPI
jgi:hypothetical protein